MTMIERIARAMCDAAWASVNEGWSLAGDEQKDEFRLMAKAALEAMRDPTPGMVEVFDEYHRRLYNPASTYRAEHTWKAMIDHASKGEG